MGGSYPAEKMNPHQPVILIWALGFAMHYYQFNIGDYKSHTEHLSEMEDLAYRRLLDWYYLHETPIPLDIGETSRQIRMRSHTECIATVLQEYFERTDNGWTHGRADKEIAKMGEKSDKASASAKARWDKQNANAMRTHSEGNATHNTEPITQDTGHITVSNDTVGAKAPRAKRGARLPDDWRLPKGWGDWALVENSHWTADVVRLEADKFADHWRAKSGKDAAKLDWEATWRNWCRSDIAQRSHPAPSSANKNGQSLNKQEALEARNREVVARMLAKENTHETS